MSLLTILETLLIGPLKLVFEIIFVISHRITQNPGLSIIALSLIMNILVLPLYRQADDMQEKNRKIEDKLHKGVAHIKKTFSGDERMMILQTYYRQNNYKPTDALSGSASLLLEVPFFMAAYQFLSSLTLLEGVSFGPITDLSKPDGIILIGGITINILPILMTLVNVISSAIYLKGFPLKTKIQLYGMATFFLVFLYNSPSGLVFYWTLNNVFSLAKTIFYKLKNPRKVGQVLLSAAGILLIVLGILYPHSQSAKRKLFLLGMGFLMQLATFLPQLHKKRYPSEEKKTDQQMFLLSGLFLTVLVGLLIPSTFLAASPQEFVDPNYFHDPLLYILSSSCMAAGTFLIWIRVFYWLAGVQGKVFFDKSICTLCGIMLTNYMFFGTDLGILAADLQYENGLNFTLGEQLINLSCILILAVILYIVAGKWQRQAKAILLTAVIALGGMSALNMVKIRSATENITTTTITDSDQSVFRLSKTGKNVVVLMLDRALGQMVPFMFNEKPELQEQFSGFTSYDNTISHGSFTNFGVPALAGGYEYTPVEMNRRADELLRDKHNEALKVMPILFLENGYEVTVCDLPYANYQWIPDMSIFDEYPEIDTRITHGIYLNSMLKQDILNALHRNFFCFSIMKTMPLAVQSTIYNGGNYNQSNFRFSVQSQSDISHAEGLDMDFMDGYTVLENLPNMTAISKNNVDTFLFMCNSTPHDPMLLQTPDYIPAEVVNNEIYDQEHTSRFTLGQTMLHIDSPSVMCHYHANMAAFIQLGKWFDYLRENGVYDNTRIILVSDHGQYLGADPDLLLHTDDFTEDLAFYYPTLMVKDFGSTDNFSVSSQFMTNADTPTLAVAGLIENPVNPFTGKPLNNEEKTKHEQFIIRSSDWDVNTNNGTQYLPAKWASVKDNLKDLNDWTFYDQETVLAQHSGY